MSILFSSLFRYTGRWPSCWQRLRAKAIHNKRGKRPAVGRLALEIMEDRTLPSTFLVTNTLDSNAGSLRQAIIDANGSPNLDSQPDIINFDIPGSGTHSIALTSPLPAVTDAVSINGWSQPGFGGTPIIELNGADAGSANGLTITAPDTTIRGLVINRFSSTGISVGATSNTWIYGNYIGLDSTGTVGRGNSTGVGLLHATGVLIGSNGDGVNDLLERNVIAGNGFDGLDIRRSSDITIRGNYLGTGYSGTEAISTGSADYPNGNGNADIYATESSNHLHIFNNLVSGGSYFGIVLVTDVHDAVIQGNRIGTNASGTEALLGAGAAGIYMISGVHDVQIGGVVPEEGNLVSGNWNGIFAFECAAVTIQGNRVGTDVTGTYAVPNGSHGISIGGSAPDILIGGTADGAGNVISGNLGVGVSIAETNGPIRVEGNKIGTDVSGNYAVGNAQGIALRVAIGVTVGGASAAARNLISGNRCDGVAIYGSSVHVLGNKIGTRADGTAGLGNAGHGILFANGAAHGTVGGTAGGEANVIAFNGGAGVSVDDGYANSIRGNSIHDNAGLGIDLANGANNNQAAPVLTAAFSSGSVTVVAGTLTSTPNATFRLEFFANAAADPEGRTLLGRATVTTDAAGHGSFTAALLTSLPAGQSLITATATDPGNNTSEFSQGISVVVQTVPILVPDPCNPQQTALVVVGSSASDTIVFTPGPNPGDIAVRINGSAIGTYHPTGRIIAYGLAGDDDIQVAGSISLPNWLFGGDGNDRLNGGNGANVLVGGSGDDLMVGGSGRDLMIGDDGADRLIGNGGDDILIGGTTVYDADLAALCAIMDEWTSNHDFATRVANLNNTGTGASFLGRLNEDYFLVQGQTVFNDASKDQMTGSAGTDWFFAGLADQLTGLSDLERAFIEF